MTGIAIYVEGGGDFAHQKAELRNGLNVLLKAQKNAARAKKISWKLVPCGGRKLAYDAFVGALHSGSATINVLLVDSEDAVPAEVVNNEAANAHTRITHLAQRPEDRWDLSMTNPLHVHLMVQCMETWLVADPDALAGFYGQGFALNVLPARQNLEDEPKSDIYDKLSRATRNTQKREYRKIKHASKLLERIDSSKISLRCPRFSTFTQWLDDVIARA